MKSGNENIRRRRFAGLSSARGRHTPLPRRRHRKSPLMKQLQRLALSVGAFAVVGAIGMGTLAPAEAASTGAGYSGITPEGGYLGNYVVPDGSRAYCMDSSADWPSGATGGAGLAGAGLTTESGDVLNGPVMQRLNYALSKYGQTGDATQAAALDAYVYAYTSTWAHYNGQGYATGTHYIDGNQAVLGAFNYIWNDSETQYNQRQNVPALTGSMSFSVDNNNYTGSLRVVNLPAGASVDLRLTNGVFTDTGSAAKNGVGNGTYAVQGVPADGTPFYKISAIGSVNAPAGWTYDANVTIYYTGGQQRVIKGGTTSPQRATYTISASDPVDRSTVFAPILTSSVETRFVGRDEPFTDTVSASIAPGSQAWRQTTSGRYIPVVAKGTLYGPFADRPNVAAQVPSGAPVAGTSTVTLNGPGKYTAPSVLPSQHAPGFYTWVWRINAADSSAGAQLFLPTDYSWSDQFGLPAETHVRAASLTGTSAVADATVGIGVPGSDTLTVSLEDGPWPTIGGKAIPAHFRNDIYWVAGDTAPVPGQNVPAGLAPFQTYSVTVSAPGQYTSSPVLPPSPEAGYLVNVWSIVQDGPGASYFTDWTDGWATPGEVTHVQAATLSGISKVRDPEVGMGASVSDTLTVSLDEGFWPESDGQPIAAHFKNDVYWVEGDAEPRTGTTIPADAALFHSSDVTVTGPGEYSSEEISSPPTSTGYLVNVWSIVHDGLGANAFKDWTDGWATPGEMTRVSAPTITTEAISSVALGDDTHDTAIVGGLLPKPYCGTSTTTDAAECVNTVTFAAYLQKDLGDEPLCEPTNEVFNTGYAPDVDETTPSTAEPSTPSASPAAPIERDPTFFYNKPVPVDQAGRFPSADVIFKKVGVYYWVATFRTGDGTVINTGECGDQKEKTVVAEDDVVTKATPLLSIGQKGHDTAVVTGVIPKEATIEFAVYKQQGSTPVCAPANEVKVGKPQPLPAAGEYTSDDYTFTDAGTFFWVEIVRNARGEVTHEGKCGADGETTTVTALAKTGSDEAAYLPIGLALVGILGAAGTVLLVATRRSKRTSTK